MTEEIIVEEVPEHFNHIQIIDWAIYFGYYDTGKLYEMLFRLRHQRGFELSRVPLAPVYPLSQLRIRILAALHLAVGPFSLQQIYSLKTYPVPIKDDLKDEFNAVMEIIQTNPLDEEAVNAVLEKHKAIFGNVANWLVNLMHINILFNTQPLEVVEVSTETQFPAGTKVGDLFN